MVRRGAASVCLLLCSVAKSGIADGEPPTDDQLAAIGGCLWVFYKFAGFVFQSPNKRPAVVDGLWRFHTG
jgi:hypothetical protein